MVSRTKVTFTSLLVNTYTEWRVGKSHIIYSDNKLYIVAMLCYICEKNIFLCLGVRIMDHVYSRGTSMKKG